ncbi:MAG: (2Fe-2S)-binding protein [Arcobacteraceae bacterium]|nr:(2Fe-2S)-binding protein [Arcobacteraceae bacterium]MDY0327476.1 2Fe-2S iron-sulfur cluster-binding protein [Arcobacteraceae bacterium]
MAKVIFMHFDKETDGLYDAKIGEPIVRLAKEKKIPISFECQEGSCGTCLVTVEHISNKEPTSYMEDFELDKLVELGAITAKEASHCQQFTISPRVRLACQMLVKGDVLIKPYKG